ncbi:MAG: hypothetical protein J1E40_03970 [Oscillospiraceae bacterium]|nr:hypothetical protein [Oscillospiraceae bacterium]
MLSIILIFVLAIYWGIISWRSRKYCPEERTAKIIKPISMIINLSPLIGIVIFTILFTFVLKGRFAERGTHALLVFAIWMYATRFYQYILAYYKKKEIFICSVSGMIFSIALAILLTPLDQYVSLIYSRMNWCSILLGCGLYIVFYAATFIVTKRAK